MKKLMIIFIVIMLHSCGYKREIIRTSKTLQKSRSMLFTLIDKKLYKEYIDKIDGGNIIDTIEIKDDWTFWMYQGEIFRKKSYIFYNKINGETHFVYLKLEDKEDGTQKAYFLELEHPMLKELAEKIK